jgi:hypothetical protein
VIENAVRDGTPLTPGARSRRSDGQTEEQRRSMDNVVEESRGEGGRTETERRSMDDLVERSR